MEKQMESRNQANEIGIFFTKMDYRIAIFSLLFLVIGFIAGSHLNRGPHHMPCDQLHKEHPMKERAHSFDKGEKEFPHQKRSNEEKASEKDNNESEQKVN
ncbi:MAG: hypothetical protein LBF32_04660 [Streptococcaceae bacterium]|nr:hypothetical protein [Streptococcaceae bacterium]